MKKAVAYLVPFMEQARKEQEEQLRAQGLEISNEVCVCVCVVCVFEREYWE